MNEIKEKIKLPHNLILKDRGELSITGVTQVDSFDESSIIAYTDCGELTIGGSMLHIVNLNLDTGDLSVEGNISSLSYLDQEPRGGGFFSRVFR